MEEIKNLQRYAVIKEKNIREIVLLRGGGCFWKKCTFCDYHVDSSLDTRANYQLNKAILRCVTGQYGVLEVVNSGSVFELDQETLALIKATCLSKKIKQLHVEAHYSYHKKLETLRQEFNKSGITLKVKIGVETFDVEFREVILNKGLGNVSPEQISTYFEECCLLVGVSGQSIASILFDINCALENFERVCINVFCSNTTKLQPDEFLIRKFIAEVYPLYKDNPRIDILLDNIDFGIGGIS